MTATTKAMVRAANDANNLCSRKLRMALQCLEAIGAKRIGPMGLESALERWQREAAQSALEKIAGLT